MTTLPSSVLAALAQLGRAHMHGRGTPREWVRDGLRLAQQRAALRSHHPAPVDVAAAQAHADAVATHYAPAPVYVDSAASEVPAPVMQTFSAVTGVDIGAQLNSLQGTIAPVFNALVDVLGGPSTGFSGGVDAQQAAYIYAGGSVQEQQRRLLDTEGVSGTASKIINGERVTVGGTGRGGPGWTEVNDATELPPRGFRG